MRDTTRLEILGHAREWVKQVYDFTDPFTKEEMYGLKSQIRRAAVSVVANIAEGYGRGSQGDFERHLRIASGSLTEVHMLSLVASDLDVAPSNEARSLEESIVPLRKRLVALTTKVAEERR